ncbi:retrovirus-related Pol polyprotein from transposon 297-like Protein [Elysia marginata]|uniref:Retrovirus-related Pol polyprotein from transposon 297-like Protein n=1 Tax=Elysia marginata TaxID=1093978 RepID=A0AAV4EW86_9GAST|nr:retrovirus-related Pol polyprotein from transposon 297-like Protein [Elysia marginata]
MALADALSRMTSSEDPPIKRLKVKVHQVFTQLSDSCLLRIKDATSTDSELNALKETIYNGWPEKLQDTQLLCRPYWNFRDETCMKDGILMKSSRIIIPKAMRPEILKTLHEPHMGIEKTKLRAREAVFWTNINEDIEDSVKECAICQRHQTCQQKEPLIQTEISPRPWHTIGTDLFYLRGDEYLLISDYYSKFPIVRKIPKHQSTSQKVTTLTKQIFNPYLSLIALRTIPLSNNLPAPGELLYNRPLQDKSPKKIFRPSNSHTIQPALLQRQESQKHYHDKNAKQLPPLSAYQNVTDQSFPSKTWEQAPIVGHTDKPRSYTIFNSEGKELRRNRTQIRPIPSPSNYMNQVQVQQQHTVHLSTLMHLDNQLATTRHKNHHRCTTNRWSTLQCRWPP